MEPVWKLHLHRCHATEGFDAQDQPEDAGGQQDLNRDLRAPLVIPKGTGARRFGPKTQFLAFCAVSGIEQGPRTEAVPVLANL